MDHLRAVNYDSNVLFLLLLKMNLDSRVFISRLVFCEACKNSW